MSSNRRLFFALMPSKALIAQVSALSAEVASKTGGSVVNVESLHVTLAFLGDVPTTQVRALTEIADEMHGKYQPFEISFTDVEYWSNVRIASRS